MKPRTHARYAADLRLTRKSYETARMVKIRNRLVHAENEEKQQHGLPVCQSAAYFLDWLGKPAACLLNAEKAFVLRLGRQRRARHRFH